MAALAVWLLLALLIGAWGVFLLSGNDYDGSRHPVGLMMIVGAAVVGAVALFGLTRERRR